MSSGEIAALVTAILSGVAAVIAALAALVQAFRVQGAVGNVQRDINGRMDELLREREERVRMAYQLDAQRYPGQPLPSPPATGRGEPLIRPMRPEHRPEDES